MMLNGRTFLYVALVCGLVSFPPPGFTPSSPPTSLHKPKPAADAADQDQHRSAQSPTQR